MDERRLRVYQVAIHPALAVAIPFFFLLLLDRLLRLLVLDAVLPPNPPATIVVLLLTGVAEAAVANALEREKVRNVLPRMRELILVLIGATLVFMVTRGYVFRGDFIPLKAEVLYAVGLVMIQWLASFSLHRSFREREVFLSLLHNMQGDDLRTGVRTYSSEATTSVEQMRRVKRAVIWFQVLVLLALFAALIGGREVSGGLRFLVLVHVALGITYTAVLNSYTEEQLYFGSGFVLPAALRRRRVAAALLLVAVAALLAAPLARPEPPLPASYLGDFFAWLNDLLTPDERLTARTAELGDRGEVIAEPELRAPRLNLEGGVRERSDLAARLFRILLTTILVALGTLLVVFVVRPLFSREFRDNLRQFDLRAALGRLGRGLARGIEQLLAGLGSLVRSPTRMAQRLAENVAAAARERRQAAVARRAVRRTAQGRAQNAAVRGFVRLIRWGERAGVSFHRSTAPLDYVQALAERVPERREQLLTVGTSFEQLVYSAHPDSSELADSFQSALRAVTRGRPAAAASAG